LAKQAITIHYRRLEDITNAFGGKTLEQSIRQAMSQTAKKELGSE
jgi:hypothetical protein